MQSQKYVGLFGCLFGVSGSTFPKLKNLGLVTLCPEEAMAGFLQASAGRGIVETKHFVSAHVIMESLLHGFLGSQCLGIGNRSF